MNAAMQLRVAHALVGINQRKPVKWLGTPVPTIQPTDANQGTVNGSGELSKKPIAAFDMAGAALYSNNARSGCGLPHGELLA